MSIDAIIYCFNDTPLADCLNCPHFLEHSGSIAGCRIKRMGEARKIVEKYQKIQEIVTKWQNEPKMKFDTSYYNMTKITEVLEDEYKND